MENKKKTNYSREVFYVFYVIMYLILITKGSEFLMKGFFLELTQFVGLVGLLGIFARFIIHYIVATPVEKALENNTMRTVRWCINCFIFVFVVFLYGFLFYSSIYPKSNSQIDVVTSAALNVTEKMIQAEIFYSKVFGMFMIAFLVFFLVLIFSVATDFFNKNYKREVYFRLKEHDRKKTIFVVKMLNESTVLVKFEKEEKYKVFSIGDMKKYTLKIETKKERETRRYKKYDEFVQEIQKKRMAPIIAVFLIGIGVFIYFSEEKILYSSLIVCCLITSVSYVRYQVCRYRDVSFFKVKPKCFQKKLKKQKLDKLN